VGPLPAIDLGSFLSHAASTLLAIGVNASRAENSRESIVIGGQKTSVSVEEAFWSGMKEIAGGAALRCRF
jgi:predicted DNA-binding ribbon-helix-helix protein